MDRRERQREQTKIEIKQHARAQIAANGSASLSLGAIARAMGITTPALYRYYASRDALITELIIEGYHALADAQQAAQALRAAEDVSGQLEAAALEYRAWALANPTDFLLIFGAPVPGFQIDPEQATEISCAARRVFRNFMAPMQAAADQGLLRIRSDLSSAATAECSPLSEHPEPLAEPAVLRTGIAAWSRIHGLVMLELAHQLEAIHDVARFYESELHHLQRDLNMIPQRR